MNSVNLTRIRNFREYRTEFGLIGAFDVIRGWRAVDPEMNIRVSRFSAPICVRKGTPDFAVLRQALKFEIGIFPDGFSPQTIVDLGANIGTTVAVYAALWPDARIFALEPDASNFDLLEKNTRHLPNVTISRAAVWPRDHALVIENPDGEPDSYRLAETDSNCDVIHGVSLPTLFKEHGIDRVDFLKIDIEGSEKALLSINSDQWLSKVGVIMVELHDRFQIGCREALMGAINNRAHDLIEIGEYTVVQFREYYG